MPVKIFDSSADGIAGLESKINAWMEALEAGAVRYISTAAPTGTQQVVVTASGTPKPRIRIDYEVTSHSAVVPAKAGTQ